MRLTLREKQKRDLLIKQKRNQKESLNALACSMKQVTEDAAVLKMKLLDMCRHIDDPKWQADEVLYKQLYKEFQNKDIETIKQKIIEMGWN